MSFVATLCFRLSAAVYCISEIAHLLLYGIGEYFQGNEPLDDEPAHVDDETVSTCSDRERFRRLLTGDDPEAERIYQESARRTTRALHTDWMRLVQAEKARPQVSREKDGPLIEEWVPGEEVAF